VDWSYEQEWRIVILSGGDEPGSPLSAPPPTAEYTGAKIRSPDLAALTEWAINVSCRFSKWN